MMTSLNELVKPGFTSGGRGQIHCPVCGGFVALAPEGNTLHSADAEVDSFLSGKLPVGILHLSGEGKSHEVWGETPEPFDGVVLFADNRDEDDWATVREVRRLPGGCLAVIVGHWGSPDVHRNITVEYYR